MNVSEKSIAASMPAMSAPSPADAPARLSNSLIFAPTYNEYGNAGPLVDALLVNVASSLIAMVIPVPGGIGVAEATLIAGLTAVGVDESTAFGITIAYRMSQVYLPPVGGWFAMRWLQRNAHL